MMFHHHKFLHGKKCTRRKYINTSDWESIYTYTKYERHTTKTEGGLLLW